MSISSRRIRHSQSRGAHPAILQNGRRGPWLLALLVSLMLVVRLPAADANLPLAVHLDASDPRSKIGSLIRPFLDLPVGAQGIDARLRRITVAASRADLLRVRLDVPVTPATLSYIAATGAVIIASYARWNDVLVDATLAEIDALARLNAVAQIAPLLRPRHHFTAGTYSSQADPIIQTAQVRSTFGVTGAGQKIGVLSDSINATGTVGTGSTSGSSPGTLTGTNPQQTGDLPASIYVYNNNSGYVDASQATDEGEALMEVAYHIAPGATYYFAPGGNSDSQFADSISTLQTAGCTLMCDDIGFTDEPMFQDGPIAQAAIAFVAAGGIFCSAAGNDANTGIIATFAETTTGTQNNWGSGVAAPGFLPLVLDPGVNVSITLEWNQPYHSWNLGPGATTDLDLFIYNSASSSSTGGNILASSVNSQGYDGFMANKDPVEIVQYSNNGINPQTVYLAVNYISGPKTNVVMRLVISTEYGNVTCPDSGILVSGTSFGHPTATTVLGIAAVPQGFPNAVETFSSLGGYGTKGLPFYFDTFGNALAGAPQLRNKPDLAAPDGLYVWNSDFDFQGPSPSIAYGFFGTSCATPAATAAASLAWCAQPALTNQQIITELKASTTAVSSTIGGTSSPDGWSGNGLVQALSSIGKSYTCISSITSTAPHTVLSGTVSISVVFTNPVTFTAAPSLVLDTTPQEQAVYSSGEGTDTLTFIYTVQSGDIASALDVTSFNFNSGAITSVNGLPIILALPAAGGQGSLSQNDLISIQDGLYATTIVGAPATSNQTTFTFTISFPVAGVSSPAAGIALSSNASLSGSCTLVASPPSGTTEYTQAVTVNTPGTTTTITLTVAQKAVSDGAGTQNLAGSGSVTYDITPPVLLGITPEPNPVDTGTGLLVSFTFDKPIAALSSGNVTITDGTPSAMMGSGATWTLPVTAGAVGTMTITLNPSGIHDLAGNALAAGGSAQVAVVNPPPAASSKCGSGGIFGFMLLGGLLALRRSRRASTTAL